MGDVDDECVLVNDNEEDIENEDESNVKEEDNEETDQHNATDELLNNEDETNGDVGNNDNEEGINLTIGEDEQQLLHDEAPDDKEKTCKFFNLHINMFIQFLFLILCQLYLYIFF